MRDSRVTSPQHHSSRPPRTTNGRTHRDCNASKGSLGLQPLRSAAHRSSNESTATPSSVHVWPASHNAPSSHGYNLTRELSDLSGSYNGTGRSQPHNATTATTPVLVAADPGGWRHAQVLSSPRLPQHPQPHTDDDSVGLRGANGFPRPFNSAIVDRGEVIEVCIHDTVAASVDTPVSHGGAGAGRTPLILLLMDPNRKLYELLQLWMDTSTDTVRDILQTVNRNLDGNGHKGPSWKQDYDGLFQVRNNHFSQLIHVLQAGKYEVVPGEVWVGKPWSMSAKQTVSYASTCLNHLKEVGVLSYRRCSDFAPAWRMFRSGNGSHAKRQLDDTVLVLSKVATQRIYVPGGILKHHHACQFLAFAPPLEQTGTDVCVEMTDCAASTASGLSDSHCSSFVGDDIGEANDEDPAHIATTDSKQLHLEDEFCNQSETEESTYSTAGSQSPIMQPKRVIQLKSSGSSRDAASTTSAVTKESAYVLRPHTLHHTLPSAQRDPPPRGIVRLLSALNCSRQSQQLPVAFFGAAPSSSYAKSPSDVYRRSGTTATTNRTRLSDDTSAMTYPTHALPSLYPLWEEDAASQSSGAPLLFTPPAATQEASSNWMSHHVNGV